MLGVQFHITKADLEQAGWQVGTEPYEYFNGTDEDGNETFSIAHNMVIRKDGHEFYSYFEDSFCADCNHWGTNRAMFMEAGLFDLPHIES